MELYPKKTVWPFPVTISNYIAWQGIEFLTQFKPYQRLLCVFQQLVIKRNQKKKKETEQVGDSKPGLLQIVVSRLLHCEPSLDPPVASLHEVHLHMQDLLMLPPAITHLVLGTSTQQAKNPWGLCTYIPDPVQDLYLFIKCSVVIDCKDNPWTCQAAIHQVGKLEAEPCT